MNGYYYWSIKGFSWFSLFENFYLELLIELILFLVVFGSSPD